MSGFWCVVPAAGRGRRFGGDVPKQYLRLNDKPLLLHTLERLAAHPRIAGLMLVVAADDASWVQGIVEVLGKPLLRATGGAERADSVLAGLRALPASVAAGDAVLVHDAARPCIDATDITRLIDTAASAGGGLLAAPLRDTLKRAGDDGRVVATEPREARWRALTPQIFPRAALEAALAAAAADGIAITDEAMAMERAGHAPLLVEGREDNIKVTTPADLALAEFLLKRPQLP
ncbi:MAG TPA: 2-C-methyl-D-erythritol 4-phosphate cytidylyltransferase [Tahibacter sp.]|uniref:2-C-methyl-D-erythritol 4-phosphate cytidylyltransferase n=1 Tax=Tahibacter sp. TaxID=2056211 RepID=UPI002C645175|nr:2-C-methyl-D-erythritol 4-phosphate cytidylyltransferase [Tahibacter sp.]HSX59056.1 2-C-methyl-D-erythritol 4-phosphate cytidylyltransferase [Tahibacter sp.]